MRQDLMLLSRSSSTVSGSFWPMVPIRADEASVRNQPEAAMSGVALQRILP